MIATGSHDPSTRAGRRPVAKPACFERVKAVRGSQAPQTRHGQRLLAW